MSHTHNLDAIILEDNFEGILKSAKYLVAQRAGHSEHVTIRHN